MSGSDKTQGLAGQRLLLCVGGGIAAYKALELVRRLREAGAEVQVAMTAGAQQFVTPLSFQALSGQPTRTTLWDSAAEQAMGHIELARWADRVIVAPATADLIARLSNQPVPSAPPPSTAERPLPGGSGGGGGGGGSASAMRIASSQPRAVAQSEPQAQGQPSPTSYAELIELARAKRDILVVTALEQSLRPVSMTDGRLDVALVPGADAGIIQVLSAKLKLWTGKHWMVSVNTSAEAVPTIREQRDQAKADMTAEAKADPLVKAILSQFPGAEVRVVEKLETVPVEAYLDAVRDEDEEDEL